MLISRAFQPEASDEWSPTLEFEVILEPLSTTNAELDVYGRCARVKIDDKERQWPRCSRTTCIVLAYRIIQDMQAIYAMIYCMYIKLTYIQGCDRIAIMLYNPD